MKQIKILIILLTLMTLFSSCGKTTQDSSSVSPSEITEIMVTEPVQTSEMVNTTTVTVSDIFTTVTLTLTSSNQTTAVTQTENVIVSTDAPDETDTYQSFTSTQENEETTEAQNYHYTKFEAFSDYVSWAESTGYPSGMLEANGVSGINQDYFHTLPGTDGYDSGCIVIGDSRCCQLGIHQQRTGRYDFAAFAVWGGHYTSGYDGIITDEHFLEVERCFQSQIESCKKSKIYFFATVNDYDCWNNDNSAYISSAVNTAERLAAMSYEMNDIIYHPEVFVIGFDGCWLTGDLFGTPQNVFNGYIQDYNDKLESVCASSYYLKGKFTTVMEIVGGKAEFIDDGLHYSDDTLEKIRAYISD